MSSWRFPYPCVKKAGKIRPIRQEGRNDVADCRSGHPRCEHIRPCRPGTRQRGAVAMPEHVSRDALPLRGRAALANLPRLLQPASRPL